MKTMMLVLAMTVAGAAPAWADRCALIEGEVVRELRQFDGACPPDPKGKPALKWLAAPPGKPPTHDPETQVMTGPSYTIGRDAVAEKWAVRAKTAEEIDKEKTGAVTAIGKVMLETMCDHEKRLRLQELKPPITDAQCRAALKERVR